MKSLTILSGKAMIVELPPEWTHEIQPSFGINHDYLWYIVKCENERFHAKDKFFKLPPGNWKIVGMLSEVTEEQAAGLVKKHQWSDGFFIYHNYNGKNTFNTFTALESLESAILAEGHTFTNPYGSTAPDAVIEGNSFDYLLWHEAQSRVLCRERCLVLRRVD